MADHIHFTTKSAAYVLAYIHRHRVKYLPGRCLLPTDLRGLVAWIGWPMPQLRTIRTHPLLAIHLAALYAAGLIKIETDHWLCTLKAFSWLRASPLEQVEQLEAPFTTSSIHEAITALGLEDTLTIDYVVYAQQMLWRARQVSPSPSAPAEWVVPGKKEVRETELWLALPGTLPPQLTFHLLQLGEWTPDQPLRMTPPSILQAVQCGYGEETIKSILRQAIGAELSTDLKAQLADWVSRAGVYRIRAVSLLDTRQPEQLAQIFAQRRLSAHIDEQISPRHAIVKETLAAPLQRWLTRQGYHLEGVRADGKGDLSQSVYTALSLQVLARLARFVPLPLSIPHHVMQAVEEALTPEEEEMVTRFQEQIMAGLRQTVRGRDGFFPANSSPNPVWIDILRGAIREESSLHISYQSLGDYRSRYRYIQPLRLETRGDLYYLHAYCYQAETSLTFRLDRIKSLWEDEEE